MKPKNANAVAAVGAGDVAQQSSATVGSVRLRGLTVALKSDVGELFIVDCARNIEGLLSDHEIRSKYELSEAEWDRLGDNEHLLRAVRAERDRRVLSGEAAREAAQRHFAKAPTVLNGIMTDEQVSPRHRIEAARELRQVVGSGPDGPVGPTQKFLIQINLGADEKFEREFTPNLLPPPDDGDVR